MIPRHSREDLRLGTKHDGIGTSIGVPVGMCYSVLDKGAKTIHHQLLYCAIKMDNHLTLTVLVESCMLREYKYG